jgi:hypothetical protein
VEAELTAFPSRYSEIYVISLYESLPREEQFYVK